MAALEGVIQKNIEERCHFIGSFDIGRFRLRENHFDELGCNLAGDDFAVLPVIFFQIAEFESQLDPFGFLVPAVDFKGLCILECIRKQGKEAVLSFSV